MSEQQRSKAAERQKRYRDRLKTRNALTEETVTSVTAQASVTESVTDEASVTLERNEYNEMIDDPGFVSPPMTAEEKELSDAVLAELSF